MGGIKKKRKEKIHIGGIYSEHRLLLQPDGVDTSSEQAQNTRWEQFVSSWELAGNRTNCFLTVDMNLDYLKSASPDSEHTVMTNMIKKRIETSGFIQMVNLNST